MVLKLLEETLLTSIFIRVYRFYSINKNKETTLKRKEVLISKTRISVSLNYYDLIKKKLF